MRARAHPAPPRRHHGRQRPLGRSAAAGRACIGHRAGARAVNVCIDFCLEHGIEALTLFAFSSENWGRPEEEVGALMKLFLGALEREVDELDRRGVRVRFIGERERFGDAIRARMDARRIAAPQATRACT